MKKLLSIILLLAIGFACTNPDKQTEKMPGDPLPSWVEGKNKDAILDFVQKVSDPDSKDFVPVEDRIAVFDNDGTLWIEKPLYIPIEFEMAWIKQAAKANSEMLDNDLYKGMAEDNLAVLKNYNSFELIELLFAAHQGQAVDDYLQDASTFLDTAKHQKYDVRFRELLYSPMLELLKYLQDSDFEVFIVTGGEIDLLRSVSMEIYNIPSQNVVGSSVKYKYDTENASVVRTGELGSANDKFVKPANIQLHIGKKPIFAAGNSDGDYEMMEYTLSGDGPAMAILVNHDDEEREYAYMHGTERAIKDAPVKGWHVVSMKNDFKKVFGR
jgi:phosphoserine phosphatase